MPYALSPSLIAINQRPLFIDKVWTTVFATAYLLWILDGTGHLLASISSSVIWLLATSLLWESFLVSIKLASVADIEIGHCNGGHAQHTDGRVLRMGRPDLTVCSDFIPSGGSAHTGDIAAGKV